MPTIYLKHKFDAAHYLGDYDGPCSSLHGHTWVAEVWIHGSIDRRTGMVTDFRAIKKIIDQFDHTLINDVIEDLPPTAENIAMYLSFNLPRPNTVRIWESENAYAEVSCE